MQWHYQFFELNGDGSETFIRGDVPLVDPVPVRKLSSPHQITGRIKAGTAEELVAPDGSTVLRRWKTTVYVADENDKIWVGGVLADYDIDGDMLVIDVAGFTAYPKGQPFDGEISAVGADPLELTRAMWNHVQAMPGGDLGLQLEATTSPVTVGTPPRDVEFTAEGESVAFQASDGAIKLNWWSTGDIGGQIDTWSRETPFDYIEDHVWNGDTVEHHLRLGYPTLGSRKPELRFVLGENVKVLPAEDYSGDDVITEVWVLGAGEGRTRVRGTASVAPRDSLRRVKQIDDKKIQNFADAQNRAREVLMAYQPDIPGAGITTLLVEDDDHAPFGSFDVGDVIAYSGDHSWGDILIWVKILTITLLPTGQLQLGVVRADTLVM